MKRQYQEMSLAKLDNRSPEGYDFMPFYNAVQNIFSNPTPRFHVPSCYCKQFYFLAFGRLLFAEGNKDLVLIFETDHYIHSFQDTYICTKSMSANCIPPQHALESGRKKTFCFHCKSALLNEYINKTPGLVFISQFTLSMVPQVLHDIMRPKWVKCGCLWINSIHFSISLKSWQKNSNCIYIGKEYEIVRSTMPTLNIVIGEIVSTHNPNPNCVCFEGFFMILAGLQIENHSDGPERDFQDPNFKGEAVIVYAMLRTLFIFQNEKEIAPEDLTHLRLYAPNFTSAMTKHPHSSLGHTLYALFKNEAYIWKICPQKCILKPLRNAEIKLNN